MRILLVEDDQKFSYYLRTELEKDGYKVILAYDSEEAEQKVMSMSFDLIILDVMLPGKSGFELCERIRKNDVRIPVMMLTSLDTVADKVRGFESGADDYLVKPFSFKELRARIEALRRRSSGNVLAHHIHVSDLELDTQLKRVSRKNKRIVLTAIEYKLLELLAKNKGRVLDRIEILDQVWGHSYNTGTNVVDVHINSLRKKIDRDFKPKLIRTVIGMGYVLEEGDET